MEGEQQERQRELYSPQYLVDLRDTVEDLVHRAGVDGLDYSSGLVKAERLHDRHDHDEHLGRDPDV